MATANVSQAGAILRKFRTERGMRQVDLAQAAGITQSIISELETGETDMSVYYARKMAQALGVPAMRFHDLRHFHATLLLRAGVHPAIVAQRLGHASVAVTMNVYSHVTPDMQSAAVDAVSAALAR
jgi:integrase